MTRTMITVCVSALVVTLAGGVAVARSADGHEPIAFETLDTNGDGQVTREEMSALRSARLASADTDGDGMLSVSELEAQASERASKRVEKMMERFDANEDGLLSTEELAENARAPRMFRRADKNGDGALSKEEFDAARDRMAKHKKAGE